jgi:hypothetical protein
MPKITNRGDCKSLYIPSEIRDKLKDKVKITWLYEDEVGLQHSPTKRGEYVYIYLKSDCDIEIGDEVRIELLKDNVLKIEKVEK